MKVTDTAYELLYITSFSAVSHHSLWAYLHVYTEDKGVLFVVNVWSGDVDATERFENTTLQRYRQELIRRWDSERELFDDDIAHT